MNLQPTNQPEFEISAAPLERSELRVDYYSGFRRPMITFRGPIDLETLDSNGLNDVLNSLSSSNPRCGVRLLERGDRPTDNEKLVLFRAGDLTSKIWIAQADSSIGSLLDRWAGVTDVELQAFRVSRKDT